MVNEMSLALLLWGGVVAGPLFIVVFIFEGALRKNYNSLVQPVSSLSIGPRGWIQQANFFISSILLIACAFGLPSALEAYGGSLWAPLLIGIYGAGLFGAGVFVTDVDGEVDESSKTRTRTRAGVLHDLCSIFVFGSLFVACFVFANLFAGAGEHSWEVYSLVTGVLYICGFFIFARGFSGKGIFASTAGLFQRLTISLGAVWLALVALHLLHAFFF